MLAAAADAGVAGGELLVVLDVLGVGEPGVGALVGRHCRSI